MYPQIIIDLKKFRHNVRTMQDMCHNLGLTMMAVSKVFCADSRLVDILIDEKVDYIADSRVQNLKKIKTSIPKVLLRLPMHTEISEVIEHTSISLNSEISTVVLLNREAKKQNKKHGIIMMIDLGDLREGIFNEKEVYHFVEDVIKLEHVELKGIGVNLTCYGGIIPTNEILSQLIQYKENIETKFNIKLDIISGGNSSSLDLLKKGQMPIKVNNLRLGESIVLGRETAYGDYINNTYDDVFTFAASIIEIKNKPSVPIGEVGMNAFGKKPTFEDKGIITRAILAVGKQDVDHNEIRPYDTIRAIGSSSDHIILDVTHGYNSYDVGDVVLFRLTYASILSLMTSKYVEKVYV
jgi:predicted amino acid racemase